MPVPWPWEALTSDSDQKRVYINWVHDTTTSAENNLEGARQSFLKQTQTFLRQVADNEQVKPEFLNKLTQSDYAYLLNSPKRMLRAADPDRIHIDTVSELFRIIDSQSIEEARAMELAETKSLVAGPVLRSYIHGADMVDGNGLHYSLKQIANRFNDEKDRTQQSLTRAHETLQELALQNKASLTETIHFAIDMRHLEDPQIALNIRLHFLFQQIQINKHRQKKQLPAINLVLIH